jgi:hypothetical protein
MTKITNGNQGNSSSPLDSSDRNNYPNLKSGAIRVRIVLYLTLFPEQNTITDIARGIQTTNGRVSHFIFDLIAEGIVHPIRKSGHPVRFTLDALYK